jgi:hypothetical protein
MVFLELFRQHGIFGTVQTVWYFWNSSDSMVFLELFRQHGIFGTDQTNNLGSGFKCNSNMHKLVSRPIVLCLCLNISIVPGPVGKAVQ